MFSFCINHVCLTHPQGQVPGSGGNKSKNVFDIHYVLVRCSSFKKSAKPGARVDILYVKKSIKTALSLDLK